jgi:ATP-dependent DNA helicase RecG
MTLNRDAEYLQSLLSELRKLPSETQWVEFKHNNSDPEQLGEYISALSNSAALEGKTFAYMVWGVDDQTHDILGTTFVPHHAKKGNQELESWLVQQLNPRLHFRFYNISIDDKTLVILEIPRANHKPTQFSGREYIRIGSNKKPLDQHPEQERELWRIFDQTPFEQQIAINHLTGAQVLELLDYPSFFDLLALPLPTDQQGILKRLCEEGMLMKNESGSWDIKNLGAILFAKDLGKFPALARKAIRVIQYEGKGKIKTLREQNGVKGYASGFEGLLTYINNLLPRNEVIGQALRKEVPMYPELSVRELVANAIIHQDFSITGMGTTIEIFDDRMEITNAGTPLVKPERFLDSPPRSRNEALASFMRRIGICEERGSGVDKVVFETELYQLPAPLFKTHEHATQAILFAYKPLIEMDLNDKTRACYLHACLRYVQRDYMTNSSLRERFGIEQQNSATASRIIRDTLKEGLIKPYDPDQSRKHARYLPDWA